MNIKQFLTSRSYRHHWRRVWARFEVRQRHDAVNRHVYVQDIFTFTDTDWRKKSWLVVDGLRISEFNYNTADQNLLETLRERYYVLHRHEILKRPV